MITLLDLVAYLFGGACTIVLVWGLVSGSELFWSYEDQRKLIDSVFFQFMRVF